MVPRYPHYTGSTAQLRNNGWVARFNTFELLTVGPYNKYMHKQIGH